MELTILAFVGTSNNTTPNRQDPPISNPPDALPPVDVPAPASPPSPANPLGPENPPALPTLLTPAGGSDQASPGAGADDNSNRKPHFIPEYYYYSHV